MHKDERPTINNSITLPRELLEQAYREVQKNKPLAEAKKPKTKGA